MTQLLAVSGLLGMLTGAHFGWILFGNRQGALVLGGVMIVCFWAGLFACLSEGDDD